MAPPGAEELEWTLLTTLPVESGDDARRMLWWYRLRLGIEGWRRIHSSGCRDEEVAFPTAERIKVAAVGYAMTLVAMLGAYLNRKHGGPPGSVARDWESLWRHQTLCRVFPGLSRP